MEMSCRVFLAVVILAAFVTCGPSPRTRIPRCRDATHKYYDPVLKRCKHCPACEPGWGLTDLEGILRVDPNTGLPVECYNCTKCSAGKYSDKAARARCQPCFNCSTLERVEMTACSSTRNAVCGTCKSMYYDIYALKYKSTDISKPCKRCTSDEGTNVAECAAYALTLSVLPDSTNIVTPTTTVATELHKPAPHTDSKQGRGKTSTLWSANAFSIVSVVVIVCVLSILFFIGIVIFSQRFGDTTRSSGTVSYHRPDPERGSSLDDPVHIQTDDGTPDDPTATGHPMARPRSPRPREEVPLLTGSNGLNSLTNPLNLQQKILLRHVGRAWPDLARAWGLTDADVEYLRAERWESEGERIHQMILTWERKLPLKATVGMAHQGLISLGYPRLAKELLSRQKPPLMMGAPSGDS